MKGKMTKKPVKQKVSKIGDKTGSDNLYDGKTDTVRKGGKSVKRVARRPEK